MNVLILGSGGREHAFAWKISQSKNLQNLYIAPGNAGTANCGTNVNISVTDFEAIKNLVWEKEYNFANSDWLSAIYETEDTSYIISGTANDDNIFLKLNSQGDSIWSKKIPKQNNNVVFNGSGRRRRRGRR